MLSFVSCWAKTLSAIGYKYNLTKETELHIYMSFTLSISVSISISASSSLSAPTSSTSESRSLSRSDRLVLDELTLLSTQRPTFAILSWQYASDSTEGVTEASRPRGDLMVMFREGDLEVARGEPVSASDPVATPVDCVLEPAIVESVVVL